MTEADVLAYLASLPGVVVETVDPGSGAPEIAVGDSFAYDPVAAGLPADHRWPFATVVTKDYPGFDEASDLDRDGVFRVNVNVGRDRFTDLFGYPPAQHADHTSDVDPSALDTVIPHPAYGQQAWVAVVNPGPATDDLLRSLLAEARDRAVARR